MKQPGRSYPDVVPRPRNGKGGRQNHGGDDIFLDAGQWGEGEIEEALSSGFAKGKQLTNEQKQKLRKLQKVKGDRNKGKRAGDGTGKRKRKKGGDES